MPEQFMFTLSDIVLCVLAAEGLLLCILQLRTNRLLKQAAVTRVRKKEALQKIQEEVKNGGSDIPVVRFEKEKQTKTQPEKKEKQTKEGYDAKELAVLQEMMAEFFG